MKAVRLTSPVPRGPVPVATPTWERRGSGFLEGLIEPEMNVVMAAATRRQYPANAVVISQGDPADRLFLLRTGCARLFFITQDGRKALLRWIVPGEILGGAALLPTPSSYLVSTEMVKDSSVFVWQRERIRTLVQRFPRLLDNALPFAMDHLTWFLAAHLALISNTARERLAQVLLSLARGIGHQVAEGIQVGITNEQLANAANITPFTASRILSEWQRNSAVVKRRGGVIVRAPERLLLRKV